MLFQVEMVVTPPANMSPAEFDAIKVKEKAYAQSFMEKGVWRHVWRVVGQFANLSIFDVDDPHQLHEILVGLPLYPYMDIKITALCRHPSSVRDDDS